MTISNVINHKDPDDSGWVVQRLNHVGLTVWNKYTQKMHFVWLTLSGVSLALSHEVVELDEVGMTITKLYKPNWETIEESLQDALIKKE